jgi:UDP-N-acetylmuramoylalanine--D-glutamate ligase
MELPPRALVLGLARSGVAAAAALERRGVEVIGADRTLGNDGDLALLDGAGLLVKSPGVPSEHAIVREARSRGLPVWSEVELGFRLLENPLVAVTGTKGKTTTCELLGAMLGAPVAGNVGRPLTGLVDSVTPGEVVVCEVSSFQLEDVHEFRPRVAVLTNLESDHLDRHGTVEAYRAAKLRVFERQTSEDGAVVPRGFSAVPGRARRVEFGADDPLPAEPLIRGAHNRANAAAAAAAARVLGREEERIADALATFPGVPHRLEPVGEVGGVAFVNDSIATNTFAARQALAAFAEPLHVILGGYDKGERFDDFALDVARADVVGAYLIGQTAGDLAAALDAASVAYRMCTTLEAAFGEAVRAARPGDVVVLSPACASYDQFRDFEHRGEEFRRLVRSLSGWTGGG